MRLFWGLGPAAAHGHRSQDYSEQPSHNKRSEKPRPLHLGKADLDVIADQRGERPGKTLNWDTPKQCLELLLRTEPVLQPPLESGLSLLERGCDSSVSVDKSRGLQRRVSNDIEEPVEGFHRGVTVGGNELQSGRVRTDLMTLT